MASEQGKTCSSCGIVKGLDEFYVDKRKASGRESQCKPCRRQVQKRYDSSDARKQNRKNSRKPLSDQAKQRRRERQRQRRNTPEFRQKRNAYNATEQGKAARRRYWQGERGKQASSRAWRKPTARLAKALRTRLYQALAQGKAGSAVRDLGCSLEDLKRYIEALWEPGMSWDNWGQGPGTWQIDHVRPLCSFDLTDRKQVKEACCFINLHPLWHEDHARKSATERYGVRK